MRLFFKIYKKHFKTFLKLGQLKKENLLKLKTSKSNSNILVVIVRMLGVKSKIQM
jgi:hypothetical protein